MSRPLSEVGLAALVVAVVAMMIVPLPTWLLDLLLATNLCLALLLLVTALFVRAPLRFGAFPTLLLITTLYRLALNVSSTRLILAQADAGEVIASFGEVVVRGDYVVGGAVFLVLTLVQFVVIARGAERVAEVGARFTLDAMPGKQLAIEADLRAGLLDAEGAASRRRALERESQFYGAMDGAMKFVKGDAIAGLAIVAVNLVGGVAIGVLSRGMEIEEALRVFALLTVGDGVVSQIPALVISTAAALVVTRVASEDETGSLGEDVSRQLFGDWRATLMAAGFAAALAVVPGLPALPFAVLAALLAAITWQLRRQRPGAPVTLRDPGAPRAGALEVRVGTALADVLAKDPRLGAKLSEHGARLYEELGVRMPAVSPVRTAALAPDAFEIRVGACAVAAGEARGSEAAEVLADRIGASARARPAALIGLEETQRELDRLAREAPALVRTSVPARVTLPRFAALLRELVSEGVSVRALREVLEAVAADPLPEGAPLLLETVRARLRGPITHARLDPDGVLRAFTLDPAVEEALRAARLRDGSLALAPELAADVVDAVRRARPEGGAIVLTQPDVRRALAAVLEHALPGVTVLSYRELDPAVSVTRLGVVAP